MRPQSDSDTKVSSGTPWRAVAGNDRDSANRLAGPNCSRFRPLFRASPGAATVAIDDHVRSQYRSVRGQVRPRALVRPAAIEKRLQLALDLDPALPEWVEGDPVRLKQVLLNLLGNAVKFTANGTVELHLSKVGGHDGLASLKFAVSDTGIGMDDEAKGRIFKVFSQADNSMTRRYGGTGLGLAISQHLVGLMGGGIAVESSPGHGSVFSFEVKLRVAPAEAVKVRVTETTDSTAPLSGRVLVVEDDRVNQKVIRLLLSKLGVLSEVVGDGEQAVQRVLAEPWDLVLMDLQMPGMDGLEATRRIRANPTGKTVPIIAITANAMPEDRAACDVAGMNGFVAKPVRQKELRQALERWLKAAAPV